MCIFFSLLNIVFYKKKVKHVHSMFFLITLNFNYRLSNIFNLIMHLFVAKFKNQLNLFVFLFHN